MLVPTPFWATAEFDIPVETWRAQLTAALQETKEQQSVPVLAPGIEILLRAYPGATHTLNDLTSVRGFAAAGLHRGADMIYTFNYMDPAPMAGGEAAYRTLLEEGVALDTVMKQPRRYPITYRDTVGPGMSNDAQLPAAPSKNPAFKFNIGPKPTQAKITLLIGLSEKEGVKEATFSATINGVSCEAMSDYDKLENYPGVVRGV